MNKLRRIFLDGEDSSLFNGKKQGKHRFFYKKMV